MSLRVTSSNDAKFTNSSCERYMNNIVSLNLSQPLKNTKSLYSIRDFDQLVVVIKDKVFLYLENNRFLIDLEYNLINKLSLRTRKVPMTCSQLNLGMYVL